MIVLLIYAGLAILFSFLCSIWEAVLLSMPDSFVEVKVSEGDPVGLQFKEMKKDVDKPLSAILSLNTVAHTVGAILVGKQAETHFGSAGLEIMGYSLPFTGIVAGLMTLGVLILSEIIPKTIGANYWKSWSGFTAKSLRIVMFLMFPLVWLSQLITKMLKGDGHATKVSREGLSAMARIGSQEGKVRADESRIINNLMRFNEIETRSIMTPRTVVRASDQSLTISDFYEKNTPLPFSRIPIYEQSKDQITGYVLKDVILEKLVNKEGHLQLKDVARPMTVVKDAQSIQATFDDLLKAKEQIALIVDEFGGMAGIVSFEDVIETLLGLEIVDEMDNTVDMQALARRNWERRAREMGILSDESPSPEG